MTQMKNTSKELTEFQLKVKELLDEADHEVTRALFDCETCSGSIYDFCKGASAFNAKIDSVGITLSHRDDYGGERKGEEYWSVYKFSDNQGNETYIKFDGWYQSYNGSEFSEWFFVEPKEKLITVYE